MGTQNLQNLQLPSFGGGVSGNRFLAEQVGRIGALQGGGGPGLEEAMTPVDTRAIGAAARGEMAGAWEDMQRQIEEAMVAGGQTGSSAQTGLLTRGGTRLAREFGGDIMRAGVGAAEAGRGRAMQGAGLRAGLAQAQTGAGQDLLSLLGRLNLSGGGGAGVSRPTPMPGMPNPKQPAGTGVGRSIAARSSGPSRGVQNMVNLANVTQAGSEIQRATRSGELASATGSPGGGPGALSPAMFMQATRPSLLQRLMGNLPGAAAMGGLEVAQQGANAARWQPWQAAARGGARR